jgi:hypothetical protein
MQKLTIQHAFYRARLKVEEWSKDLDEKNMLLSKAAYAKDLEDMAEIDKILDDAWTAELEGILDGLKA